jgi:hypothetical protein
MLEWPWKILTPREENWRLSSVTANGGQTVGGVSRLSRLDGGGLWVGEQSFFFHTVEKIRVARALEALMDGGATPMIAFSFEEPFSPLMTGAPVSFSDGASFGDGSLFAGVGFTISVSAGAALRSTSLVVSGASQSLLGGERFSIIHPTMGRRRYTVGRVDGDVLTIRPPLREGVVVGDTLDFNKVGCPCRLANPDEFLGALQVTRHIEATARWIEAF